MDYLKGRVQGFMGLFKEFGKKKGGCLPPPPPGSAPDEDERIELI